MVVYDSIYGNTERLAKALAVGLKDGGVDVDIVKVDLVKSDELGNVDLLCVGSPTHAWNASKPMQEFLERLKTEGLTGKKAFAFDTKMKSRLAGDAGGKIERKLKDAGLTIAKHSEFWLENASLYTSFAVKKICCLLMFFLSICLYLNKVLGLSQDRSREF